MRTCEGGVYLHAFGNLRRQCIKQALFGVINRGGCLRGNRILHASNPAFLGEKVIVLLRLLLGDFAALFSLLSGFFEAPFFFFGF